MADSVNEQWVYPPNWDGNAPEKNGWRRVVKMIRCVSDGTGETDVTKIDISELRCLNGSIPTRTVIEYISFDIKGFTSILLEWDRAANVPILTMGGDSQDSIDFKEFGGLVDPGEEGDRTGDILLTSNGADAGDVYNILICARLKEN